jgi:predicted MPP superfamily phosphohydrolase
MEEHLHAGRGRQTPEGLRPVSPLAGKDKAIERICRWSGMYGMGRRNAARPQLTEVEFHFSNLPQAFDGYRILFLSDLHVRHSIEALAAAIPLTAGLSYDLVVLGGDYQNWGWPAAVETAEHMRQLLAALTPTDGVVGVLGNHDTHDLVPPLEALGVRMLINESMALTRNGQSIHLIGCDDVGTFYDHGAQLALHQGGGFRIALVHSSDFAEQAAAAGCSFYLAGHTHGGQICLPGGRPIVTALDRNHQLARGSWRLHGMQGYTSTGLGSGRPAVRFNCPPEIALITLRRDKAAPSLT